MASEFHVWELFMGLMGMFGAMLVVLVFVLLPQHRKHPAELILCIAICDLFLALRFVIRAISFLAHPAGYKRPHSMHLIDDDCTTSVVWATIWETGSLSWNAVWCFNFVYQLRYPSKDTEKLFRFYFLYAVLSIVVLLSVVMGTNTYGLASFGTYEFCGEADRSLHSAAVSMVFAYTVCTMVLALASLVYAHNRLGMLSGPESRSLLVHHSAYVVIFFLLWLGQRTINRFHSHVGVHQVFALFWIAQAFFIAAVRLSEPRVLPALLRKFGMPDSWINRLWPREAVIAFSSQHHDPLLESLVDRDDDLFAESDPDTRTSSFSMSMKKFGQQSSFHGSTGGDGGDNPRGAATWGPDPGIRAELELVDAMGSSEQPGPNRSRLEFDDGPDPDALSIHGDM
eukprot:m.56126 g.56126  ORF g.56126 m.56126 type:complete len:397 (-) comp12582_c0_seq1:92-1282(-)